MGNQTESQPSTVLAELKKRYPGVIIEERTTGGVTAFIAHRDPRRVDVTKPPVSSEVLLGEIPVDAELVNKHDVERLAARLEAENLADAPQPPSPPTV